MMRALVYTAPSEIELLELPMPKPGRGEVLIKVAWCGICGSEVESFVSGRRRKPPLIMGHEFSGIVAECGFGVSDLEVGERVVINPLIPCNECELCVSGYENVCPKRQLLSMHRPGGYAEYVSVPRRCIFKLPEELSLKLAALSEPLANAVHAYRLIGTHSFKHAVIIGAGTIGLLCLQVVKHFSHANVFVVEPIERKRHVALSLGADVAVNPNEVDVSKLVGELTDGMGANVCFDAVGKSETRALSCKLLSPRGVAVWIGLHDAHADIDGMGVVTGEKCIRGSYAYSREEFEAAVKLLCDGHVQ
ncbi:MAG: alcohol dehydrogenase catalytic domain-containing protein, partial [Armatimonadota bacterium]|nr:alcohol dehydrogenase catalytic domain-containing protein [Armatimonadota bacterium]MDW8026187.1 alcohol dehydrogenase catalytic domain-containing protein [Armatimonadota bacterium]